MVKVKKDLIGQKYGRLTVIDRAEDHILSSGKHVACWLCKCDCGNEKVIQGKYLRRGETKSCGCLKSEYMTKYNHKENRYEFDGDVGRCYFNNCDEYFLFDTEDYDKIKDCCWSKNAGGYANGNVDGFWGVHRLILDCPKELEVDHINHNRLDNRKCNLRICTKQQNAWNSRKGKYNKTGYRGVTFIEKTNKYRATISIGNKHKFLGDYNTAEEAYQARLKAEKKYHGEFALNESA